MYILQEFYQVDIKVSALLLVLSDKLRCESGTNQRFCCNKFRSYKAALGDSFTNRMVLFLTVARMIRGRGRETASATPYYGMRKPCPLHLFLWFVLSLQVVRVSVEYYTQFWNRQYYLLIISKGK